MTVTKHPHTRRTDADLLPPSGYKTSATLSVYLARRFITVVLLTAAVLGFFTFLMDYIELTRRLAGRTDVSSGLGLYMTLLKMPDLLIQVMPFAILIGTVVSLADQSRHHEIVAMRAAGIPARQFLLPHLLSCLLIGLITVAALNPLAAATLKSYQRINADLFPGSAQGLVTEGGSIWLRQQEKTGEEFLIHGEEVLKNGTELKNASFYQFAKDMTFLQRLDTPVLKLEKGRWVFGPTLSLQPGQPPLHVGGMSLATRLTPAMIQNSFTSPRTLPIWEMKNFIRLLQQAGFPTAAHELQFHRTLATPALTLAMFLLGAPFALRYSRRHTLMSLITAGLLCGFLFYLLTNFIGAYGLAGKLNLVLAAWMPTLIATLLGLTLMVHFKEE